MGVTKRVRPSQVTLNLGNLKGAWLSWCLDQGVEPSAAFRQIVSRLTGTPEAKRARGALPEAPLLPRPVAKGQGEKRTVRREIAITPSEFEVVEALAAAAEVSVPRYLANLVRAKLTGEPQIGQGEFEMLTQSNLELLAIGRNLNQIVKLMNTEGTERHAHRLAVIVSLRDYIKEHAASVAAVMAANQQRWRVE